MRTLWSKLEICAGCADEKLCTEVVFNGKKVLACLSCESYWKRTYPYMPVGRSYYVYQGKIYTINEIERLRKGDLTVNHAEQMDDPDMIEGKRISRNNSKPFGWRGIG